MLPCITQNLQFYQKLSNFTATGYRKAKHGGNHMAGFFFFFFVIQSHYVAYNGLESA